VELNCRGRVAPLAPSPIELSKRFAQRGAAFCASYLQLRIPDLPAPTILRADVGKRPTPVRRYRAVVTRATRTAPIKRYLTVDDMLKPMDCELEGDGGPLNTQLDRLLAGPLDVQTFNELALAHRNNGALFLPELLATACSVDAWRARTATAPASAGSSVGRRTGPRAGRQAHHWGRHRPGW
jgi:hypothetical protein